MTHALHLAIDLLRIAERNAARRNAAHRSVIVACIRRIYRAAA